AVLAEVCPSDRQRPAEPKLEILRVVVDRADRPADVVPAGGQGLALREIVGSPHGQIAERDGVAPADHLRRPLANAIRDDRIVERRAAAAVACREDLADLVRADELRRPGPRLARAEED